MRSNVTIKDVARHADVSISTVSRVLNGNHSVNPELKERVIAAAKELSYSPNVIAKSLKGGSMRLVAYIVSNTADPFFTIISRGMEELLYDNGYNLINCSTNFSIDRENTFLQTLSSRKVDGILINTVGNNDAAIAKLSQSIPIVLSNRAVYDESFQGDFADFDNKSGMLELTNQMLKLGHRKIGILTGPHFLSTASERNAGFFQAMSQAGLSFDRENYPYYYEAKKQFSQEEGYFAAEHLLKLKDPPTALIAANSEMALGAMDYCRVNGIRIPEDLSLCCYGNIEHNELLFKSITHMHMDLYAFGVRIAELMLERINRQNQIRPRELRFSTSFHVGESAAALR